MILQALDYEDGEWILEFYLFLHLFTLLQLLTVLIKPFELFVNL